MSPTAGQDTVAEKKKSLPLLEIELRPSSPQPRHYINIPHLVMCSGGGGGGGCKGPTFTSKLDLPYVTPIKLGDLWLLEESFRRAIHGTFNNPNVPKRSRGRARSSKALLWLFCRMTQDK